MSALAALLVLQAADVVPMAREPFHHPVLGNAALSVLDVRVPAGGHMLYHAHPTNHLAIIIAPGQLHNEVIGRPPADRFSGPAGTVVYVGAGPPHRQFNTGTAPLRFIAVELTGKGDGAGVEQGSAPSGAWGCETAIDKPEVHVTRCRVAPGASVRVAHAGAFLRIPITDGRFRDSWSTQRRAAGTPLWHNAREYGRLRNLGPTPLLFVDVEVPRRN